LTPLVSKGRISISACSNEDVHLRKFVSPQGAAYLPLSSSAPLSTGRITYLAQELGPTITVHGRDGFVLDYADVLDRSVRESLFSHPGSTHGADIIQLACPFRLPLAFNSFWIRGPGCAWKAVSTAGRASIDIYLDAAGSVRCLYPVACHEGEPPTRCRVYSVGDGGAPTPFAEMATAASPLVIDSLPVGSYRLALEQDGLFSQSWIETSSLEVEAGLQVECSLRCIELSSERLAALSVDVISSVGLQGHWLLVERYDEEWMRWREIAHVSLEESVLPQAQGPESHVYSWMDVEVPGGRYPTQVLPIGHISPEFVVVPQTYIQRVVELDGSTENLIEVRDARSGDLVDLQGAQVWAQRAGEGRGDPLPISARSDGTISFTAPPGVFSVALLADRYGLTRHTISSESGQSRFKIHLGLEYIVEVLATKDRGQAPIPVESWKQLTVRALNGCCHPRKRFSLAPGQADVDRIEVSVCGEGQYELGFSQVPELSHSSSITVEFPGSARVSRVLVSIR